MSNTRVVRLPPGIGDKHVLEGKAEQDGAAHDRGRRQTSEEEGQQVQAPCDELGWVCVEAVEAGSSNHEDLQTGDGCHGLVRGRYL